MKILLPIFLICTLSVSGQTLTQKKISIYKTFGGVVYEMDTLQLSSKQVGMLLMQNQEAYHEFKIARSQSTISSILGFSSGLLVAVPLVTAVAGGQPEWILAAGGGALFLASIPFSSSSKGHALNAIELYNAKLSASNQRIKSTLYFTGSSASLIIRF
ncbi:MAG: hypothetical protein HYZ44_12465 [Bacteroidetes bacterium]|nr:hypothetical protein [Bacteroidota bacterium]